ncbi:hypothetical protein F0562_006269 [Nyssa sinensis]|uniref:MYB transcription factor n=1 Tax=Nyssa sinensis TaxID=561372 RepID=A0A5J5ALF4_9ASTE|nr:hypothetical protein F0562_006269 [Nyssa sinensis]
MGAPKQKWSSEEEAALRAGVAKYGAGKWSTILKDPEFSSILYMRSNVDLKDKWRNMNVKACGLGSRQRARLAYKNNQQIPKHDDKPMALSTVVRRDVEIVDAKPLAISSGTLQNAGDKKPISRWDNLILEAISNLKEPRGSNRTTIAMYIEEQYSAPPELERLLAANLKLLIENGKLIKVKHQYRIAPTSTSFDPRRDSSLLPLEGKQKNSPKVEKNDFKTLTKSQIDAELEKMRSMTAHEAAACCCASSCRGRSGHCRG